MSGPCSTRPFASFVLALPVAVVRFADFAVARLDALFLAAVAGFSGGVGSKPFAFTTL